MMQKKLRYSLWAADQMHTSVIFIDRRNSQKASIIGIYFFTCKVYIQVFIVCVTIPIVPELLHDNKQKCNASKESPLNASSFQTEPCFI